MTRPRFWRPSKFSEIIGQNNAAAVQCLQIDALNRRLVIALLLGPYGSAKTSLARLLMASYCCAAPDPKTADPCQACESCLRQGPDFSGEFHNFRHWEIDCTADLRRKDVAEVLRDARQEDGVVLFFDELPRLSERSAQFPLLKFTEDLRRGMVLAAAMQDRHELQPRVLAPLFERMRKFYLSIPEIEEMVTFFKRMTPTWEVRAEEEVLRELVNRSSRSFRTCLDVIDVAASRNPAVLDSDLLDEFLSPAA